MFLRLFCNQVAGHTHLSRKHFNGVSLDLYLLNNISLAACLERWICGKGSATQGWTLSYIPEFIKVEKETHFTKLSWPPYTHPYLAPPHTLKMYDLLLNKSTRIHPFKPNSATIIERSYCSWSADSETALW